MTGRATRRKSIFDTGCSQCGVLGSVQDGKVELSFLTGWSARDTMETFVGELRGDTLVGSYRFAGGIARFVKER